LCEGGEELELRRDNVNLYIKLYLEKYSKLDQL